MVAQTSEYIKTAELYFERVDFMVGELYVYLSTSLKLLQHSDSSTS